MTHALVLGRRALREGIRTPEAIVPTLFIPLFFLVVNVGQVAKIFPSSSTGFLHGQGYGAFQLPNSLLLAASFGSAALFLVEEIEGGYFDKLRATPIPRSPCCANAACPRRCCWPAPAAPRIASACSAWWPSWACSRRCSSSACAPTCHSC